MQICEGNKELLPGDPLCAPVTSAIMEANICMMRRLHQSEVWGPPINRKVIDQLTKIKDLEKSHKPDGEIKIHLIYSVEVCLLNLIISMKKLVWPKKLLEFNKIEFGKTWSQFSVLFLFSNRYGSKF